MNATKIRSTVSRKLRILPGLLLALTLLPGAVGPVAPVLADEPTVRDHRDPDARVLLVISKIIVHNDMDWGDGDISIKVKVRTNGQECAPLYHNEDDRCGRLLVESDLPELHASDGETLEINRRIPSTSDSIVDPAISPDLGIPIHTDEWYGLSIKGTEIDTTMDDEMGTLDANFIDENGQIRFGTHTERSVGQCVHQPRLGFCGPGGVGAFSVEYEIRPAFLPDLKPVDIKVLNVPGSGNKLVCTAVQNTGVTDVGAFQMTVQVDGVVPPGGRFAAGQVFSGQARELCAEMTLPPSGQHQLTAIADEPQAIAEVSETNNRYVEGFVTARTDDDQGPLGQVPGVASDSTGPGTSAAPTPMVPAAAPSTPDVRVTTTRADLTRPDLTVSAIRVNGQVPDGKKGCTAGKNAVTVAIENAGDADAESFTVRLVVDGDQGTALEQSVTGLKAGQEREVRFDEIRLMKGERKLTVTVDAKNTVEANEDNNVRTVTATCQNAG